MSQQALTNIEVLSRDECLELLKFHSFVGRIAYVVDSVPIILPVNYLADDESVVFCTAAGRKLSWLSNRSRVAFEVDNSQALDHSGWSVLIQGTAVEVSDPEELETLRRGPLRSWAQSPDAHWVRIAIGEISGRRLHGR